jgi:predicted DNA-binding transcriptional regulator AlpA
MRFLTEVEAARALALSRRALQRYRVIGGGPPFTRVGARKIAYSEQGIREWAEARTFPHRAAEIVAQERATT